MPALLTLRWLKGAGRRGSLPLQDLIRDLKTDDLDQQNLCVGAGRFAGPCVTCTDLCGGTRRPSPKCQLRSVPPTTDTNADERSATGQRQGEGARLRGDAAAESGDTEVAGGKCRTRRICVCNANSIGCES